MGRGSGGGLCVLIGGREIDFHCLIPFLPLRLYLISISFILSSPTPQSTGAEVPVLYAHLRDGAGGDISLGLVCFQEAGGHLRGRGRRAGVAGSATH